jgi:hypothetical protein
MMRGGEEHAGRGCMGVGVVSDKEMSGELTCSAASSATRLATISSVSESVRSILP